MQSDNNRVPTAIGNSCNHNRGVGNRVRPQEKNGLFYHFRKFENDIVRKLVTVNINGRLSLGLRYNRLCHHNWLIRKTSSLQIFRCIVQVEQIRRAHLPSLVICKLFCERAIIAFYSRIHNRVRYLSRFFRIAPCFHTVNQSPLRFGQPVVGFLCRGLSF